MTPEEHKSYEEAADDYWLTIGDTFSLEIGRYVKTAYQKGCEHAHKLIEDAEREWYNRALDEVLKKIDQGYWFYSASLQSRFIEELKKLKR